MWTWWRAHPEFQNVIGIDKVIKPSEDGTFFEGNAEALPLPSGSVDLIINIESSHLYDNPKNFFSEVYRVLKPNGYFCWADLRYKDMMARTLEEVAQAKLHLTSYENITAEVLNGIEFTSKRYDKMLEKAPWFIKIFENSIRATYCAPGTHTYNRFARREKIYAAACWCKKEIF
uniref:Methyltransferase type 11 domain-containing protein n=1 Tax=Panagrolaimus sp. ES5 TaxID=591445 RepID=A0AC34EZZ8_9BILA